MMILGITGSIGSGKSLACDCFRRRGWRVFDADACCRRVWNEPERRFLEAVEARFGDALFDAERKLDRKKIADAVFGDAGKMNRWQELIYPELDKKLREAVSSCRKEGKNGVFELPLLFEKHYEKEFDAVLAVWSGADMRRARLKKFRAFDDGEIDRREALQLAEENKLEKADYAVINRGSVAFLDRQIGALIKNMEFDPKKKGIRS